MTWRWSLAAAGVLILASDAAAQSIDELRSAHADGRFLEAADLGESLGTSVGYTMAAKSLALHAHYTATGEQWGAVIERAMRMGEAAVKADPTSPDAHCHYAHAVARYAQRSSTITALRQNLAGKIRDLLETALEIDSDHALTHMMLGIWHADVAASGFLARTMYGANREDAIYHYDRALELEPDSKILLYEYAISLPGLDEDGGAEAAREMLEKALALPVRDAHEEWVHLDILDGLDRLEGK